LRKTVLDAPETPARKPLRVFCRAGRRDNARMTRAAEIIAHAAALDLPRAGEAAPDWVHLLPAGPELRTFDGRGPYRVEDPAAVVAASRLERFDGELPIDENHATDIRGAAGGSAPAFGWITAMEARADGIWGRVAWTAEGARLVAGRAYRGLSPVIAVDKATGRVLRLLRASLTNVPNLRGLAALNMESPVTFIERLAARLGLPADAGEDRILAALPDPAGTAEAQAALGEIGTALGVNSAEAAVVLAAAHAAATARETLAATQAELAEARVRLAAAEAAQARRHSEAWIEAEIARGRYVRPDQRQVLVEMHMADPAKAATVLAGYPSVAPATPPGTARGTPKAGAPALTELHREAARRLGVSEEAVAKVLAQEAIDRKETR
jgi:phage I-like protein